MTRLAGGSDSGGQQLQQPRVHHHPELEPPDGTADEGGYLSGEDPLAGINGTAAAEHGYLLQGDSADWKSSPKKPGQIAIQMSARDPCLEIPLADLKKLDDTDGEDDGSDGSSRSGQIVTWRMTFTLSVLLFANLLNYMDRLTIGGVLSDIQHYYTIGNADAGLIQTSFICSYMIFSPIFGFLGDRCKRTYIMAIGIGFWSIITLLSSFVPADKFWLFLLMRGLVGIGEASYSTIAPTIIADLFVGGQRTKALSVFYFAIPIGSGLGYIVGSNVAHLAGSWQWALRVTPVLGVACVLLILFLVKEPPRGASEGGTHLRNTSYFHDLCYLVKNKSFLLSTGGFTCVAFVAGALALWTPTYMNYAVKVLHGDDEGMSEGTIGLIFGVITCCAGFIGVGIGTAVASKLRATTLAADPLVCAFGMITSAPFLFTAMFISKYNEAAVWVMVFFSEVFICLNWALVTDIVLYTVIPTRRSTAEALQILISHALGDAGSPYLIGYVSDKLRNSGGLGQSSYGQFISLNYSLYMTCFAAVLGGGFFLATALFVGEDRKTAELATRAGNVSSEETSPISSQSSGLSAESNTRTQTTMVVPNPPSNHINHLTEVQA